VLAAQLAVHDLMKSHSHIHLNQYELQSGAGIAQQVAALGESVVPFVAEQEVKQVMAQCGSYGSLYIYKLQCSSWICVLIEG